MGTQDKIRKKEQYNELLDKLKRSGHFGERLKEIGVLGKPRRIFSRVFPTPSLPVCIILNIENLELKTLDRVFSKVHTNNDFVD